jgi:hypothetical protein
MKEKFTIFINKTDFHYRLIPVGEISAIKISHLPPACCYLFGVNSEYTYIQEDYKHYIETNSPIALQISSACECKRINLVAEITIYYKK